MTWLPIAQTLPQYEDLNGDPASGYVIKCYAAGTSTNINIATDNTGGTTVTSVALDSLGNPAVSGTPIIPHVEESYKISFYANQADADLDVSAIWTIDNITAAAISGINTDETAKVSANDTTAGYLNGKLVAGDNVKFTENNNGANESLTIAVKDQFILKKGADVTSANALTLGTDGNYFDITGTTAITSITTIGVGTVIKLHFDAILTLTHDSSDLILPGAGNITTAAGDEAEFVEYAAGNWRCLNYQVNDLSPVPATVSDHIRAGNKQVSKNIDFGTGKVISALTTITNFETFGPTGSGATNIWTDMDVIPAGATVLLCQVNLFLDASTTGVVTGTLYATSGDVVTPFTGTTSIASSALNAGAIGSRQIIDVPIEIPLDTSRVFKSTWNMLNHAGTSSISIAYRGFITD